MSSRSKNLEYEANEPAFLRRLRAQNAGGDGRHERPLARPKKARTDDEDDAPAYVVQDSNETLSKAEYETLLKSQDASATAPSTEGASHESGSKNETLGITGTLESTEPKASGALSRDRDEPAAPIEATMGSKKRKVAKVIGGDPDGNDRPDELIDRVPASDRKKPRRKGKSVKLSFDNDDNDHDEDKK